MLKKVLYIAASFLVGFMLLSSVVVTTFYTVFQTIIAEDVKNGEYTSAERFFSRVIDDTKFYAADHEGTTIEVYAALNDSIRYVYDAEGKKTETSYYTLESSIQFTFFNLPEDFALVEGTTSTDADGATQTATETEKKGGIKLVLSDGKIVFFPFITDAVDYYSFATSYSYLPLSITYDEYTAALTAANASLSADITSAIVIDGDGEEEFGIVFESGKNPTFNTTFHNNFYDILVRYNDTQLKSAKGEEVSTEETNKIVDDYNAVMTANPNYFQQHNFDVVYGSGDFLFPVIATAVVFLAADVALGWFIFRKKKRPTYVPPGRVNQPTQPQRQPEQFNRDVFNVEEDDVVETTSQTENKPETE